MISLKHKTISGIKWTFAASIAQRVISFGTMVFLARLLTPMDFGLFALAFVMIDGFGIFKSLGFDTALVRRKGDDIERACNTAFFLIPAMGMILFIILFFFAPIGARFLNNPQVTPIIRTLGIIFVISTFGKVPQTVLYRDMKFKYKSIAEVSASVVYCAIAVLLALNQFGVWSLVIAYIAKNFVLISIEWYFSGWKPKFEFDKALAWEMFHFGKYILGGGIIWFFYSNADNLLIGKLLGVTMLGYYAISLNIATFLSQYFLGKISQIMLPAYSKIQDDTADTGRVMTKMLRSISIVSFPFSFILMVFAPDILSFVFGEKWLPATSILRILAVLGISRSLNATIAPAFVAKGKSKLDFQINLMMLGIFLGLIVPLGLKFKLLGVGIAVVLSSLFSLLAGLARLKKYLQIDPRIVLNAVKEPFFCALSIPIVGFSLKMLFQATFSPRPVFFIAVGGALSAYMFLTFMINKTSLKDIKEAFIPRVA